MAYGQKSNVGIIFQNSFGAVGAVGSIHFIPHLSSNLGLNIPPLISENMRGIFDEGDTYEGPRTVDGDISSEAQPIPLGALLKSVLELKSSTQSGGIYAHLFEPRVADFDEVSAGYPLTVYQNLDTGSAQLFSDLNGTLLELGIANGELLKTSVTYVGGTFAQVAAAAASYPTGKRWTWDVASVTVAGAGIPELGTLTIKVDEALEAMHTLNTSKYPSRIKRTGMRTIAVDGTLKFDNQDQYQEFLSQSERELVLHFTGPTEIQSGYYETVNIKLPLLRYEEAKPATEGPGQIEMTVTAKGKYSVTSATAFQATLVNTQATY